MALKPKMSCTVNEENSEENTHTAAEQGMLDVLHEEE